LLLEENHRSNLLDWGVRLSNVCRADDYRFGSEQTASANATLSVTYWASTPSTTGMTTRWLLCSFLGLCFLLGYTTCFDLFNSFNDFLDQAKDFASNLYLVELNLTIAMLSPYMGPNFKRLIMSSATAIGIDLGTTYS
jgi:hypothetical protein